MGSAHFVLGAFPVLFPGLVGGGMVRRRARALLRVDPAVLAK
jgi:hypothetical protein